MSGGWAGSERKSRLPLDWPQKVAKVKQRAGGRCEAVRSKTGLRCTVPGSDVDHVTPGDDHRLENLQLLCRWHHNAKSSREGNEAKAQVRQSARRSPEKHPGARTT